MACGPGIGRIYRPNLQAKEYSWHHRKGSLKKVHVLCQGKEVFVLLSIEHDHILCNWKTLCGVHHTQTPLTCVSVEGPHCV